MKYIEHLGAVREPLVGERPDWPYRRTIFVGECNPLGSDPRYQLYDLPPNCSGYWLKRLLDWDDPVYRAHWRTNLCIGEWNTKKAIERAELLFSDVFMLNLEPKWEAVILLGVKVRDAFAKSINLPPGTLMPPFDDAVFRAHGVWMCVVPHPSGRNRIWNEPGARGKAAHVIRSTINGANSAHP